MNETPFGIYCDGFEALVLFALLEALLTLLELSDVCGMGANAICTGDGSVGGGGGGHQKFGE